MGWLVPSRMPLSMSSAEPTPWTGQQHHSIQYNTIQYNTIQYNTIQYDTIQYNINHTTQHNTILTIQYTIPHTSQGLDPPQTRAQHQAVICS
jgi:hypothetical protein